MCVRACMRTHAHTPAIAECVTVSFFCVFTHTVPSTWDSLASSSTFKLSVHPLIASSIMSSSWGLDAPCYVLLHAFVSISTTALNKLYCNSYMLPWVSSEVLEGKVGLVHLLKPRCGKKNTWSLESDTRILGLSMSLSIKR